jgi:hypothetical protein
MKKISTPYSTSWRILPYTLFGFLGFFLLLMIKSGALEKSPIMLALPCVMAAIGYFSMRQNYANLADEVYDCGDCLLVQKGGEEDRVPLSNIINVNFTFNRSGARITLTLEKPGKFGAEITFIPPPQIYTNPLPKNEIAADLVTRAGQARNQATV